MGDFTMLNCRIQRLEQVKDGWHIRFSGGNEDFWMMLSNFKTEQHYSHQLCHYVSSLFEVNVGGWFCTDTILKKYASDFSNYQEMRDKAEQDYQSSGRAAADRREKEEHEKQEAERRKQWRERVKEETERVNKDWGEFTSSGTGWYTDWYWNSSDKQQQREKDWEETKRRQEQEQRNSKPPKRVNTNLTIEEALTELGLSPIIPLQKLTEKEVKTAFRAKALKAHPDVGGSHEQMVKLNNAYQLVLIFVQKATV